MHRFARILLGLAVAMLARTEPARADVVGPKPFFCGPGKVGVSSHEGSRCEKKAPTNCPPGWGGVIGGECRIATCRSDRDCAGDETCDEVMACIETRPLFDRRHPLAMPMSYDAELGICGPGAACDAPRRCEKRSVCVRGGEVATVYVPPPGQYEATGLPRRSSGCGGCAVGEEGGAATTFLVGAAFALARATRRKGK
ncbi:hypothetical protein [Polyangium mundeleinium]|uniref:Uncharacterized protein n=1 Tax=Polyangium mundeleinium TaxID=2995306 RepID=A0ABT5ES34_9BACT|nr:hypothetical protein [Polyangium mundeleinium]MDC0744561.1 hypothetical protein [Polyangium mundeleinium]